MNCIEGRHFGDGKISVKIVGFDGSTVFLTEDEILDLKRYIIRIAGRIEKKSQAKTVSELPNNKRNATANIDKDPSDSTTDEPSFCDGIAKFFGIDVEIKPG